jgi:hypothetical protein
MKPKDEAMSNPRLALRASACLAALCIIGVTTAYARQTCSTEAGSQGYWSWRMIDGRKCWYEGKPMLSKSMLEWPAETAAQPDAGLKPTEADEAMGAPAMRRIDPMDAQASMRNGSTRDESPTFDALWRKRIENR